MSKPSCIINKPLKKTQYGQVSLQNVFWIVGIIVGLLTIAQISMTYFQDNLKVSPEKEVNTETSKPEEVKQEKIIPAALSSPHTKIDTFIAYDNGIAVDTTTDLVWMRCSLGQEWNGSHCEGRAKTYYLDEAQSAIEQLNKVSYVGLYEWQIPDVAALHSLIYCSDGYDGSYPITLGSGNKNNVTKPVAVDCAGNSKLPAINAKVFPETQSSIWRGYWTSSKNSEDKPLAVYFNDGKIKAKDKAHYLRPVRVLNAE